MSRVARVETSTVEVPCPFPIQSAVRSTSRVVNVLVVVHTDDGLHGSAYVAAFTRPQARAIHAMLEELEPCIHDMPIIESGAAWWRMQQACRLLGGGGAGTSALSALDIALWDVKAKSLGVPLHALLGTAQQEIEAYASDGCWLTDDLDEIAGQATGFVSQGFRTVKVRVGRQDPKQDLAALDEIRGAVGQNVELLVDANQAWSLPAARSLGRLIEGRGITWLEEPIAAGHVEGLAQLQRELTLRIVAGENAYLPRAVQSLIEARAAAVVMPDVQRIGGVTGWLRAGAITDTAGLQLSSHLFPEVSAHLLAAVPGAGPLEYVSWMTPFVDEPLEIRDGVASVPGRPGIGFEFDWSELKEYVVD